MDRVAMPLETKISLQVDPIPIAAGEDTNGQHDPPHAPDPPPDPPTPPDPPSVLKRTTDALVALPRRVFSWLGGTKGSGKSY